MAAAATERMFALEQPVRCLAKARDLPGFHAECLHNPVAGDGFLKNVLNVSQLVLSASGSVSNATSDLAPPRK